MDLARTYIGENGGSGGVKWDTWKLDGNNYQVEIESSEQDLRKLVQNIVMDLGVMCSWVSIASH